MRRTVKAEITRARLVSAAAAILREEGPQAVTYRNVAKWAQTSPSSTNYYFDSIHELLREAGERNITLWAQRAERAAARAESLTEVEREGMLVELLLDACLPHDPDNLRNHYAQLIAASQSQDVSGAYRAGRRRLDSAVGRILAVYQSELTPEVVIALVDGAAVAAISEGRSVFETAQGLVARAVEARRETVRLRNARSALLTKKAANQ